MALDEICVGGPAKGEKTMTEQEWLECADLWRLLGHLRGSKKTRSRVGQKTCAFSVVPALGGSWG